MAKPPPSPFPFPPKRMYEGADIPMRVIRRYARAIADEFHPDEIILFGSYAYGTPHEASDVDLLVVMPARDRHVQSVRIQMRLAAPFPLDLLVRTPKEMTWRLAEGESFTTTIVTQGKVLYEKGDMQASLVLALASASRPRERCSMKKTTREWVGKAEEDYQVAVRIHRSGGRFHDGVCFHCQQCAEKYLKALMEELGLPVPKTHALHTLLPHLMPHHPTLRSLKRGLVFLSSFAVDPRYPGRRASKRQAVAALRWMERVRTPARAILGIRERRTEGTG